MAFNETLQYMNYVQPSFAPPSSWFGPVWTFLYIIIALTFGYVFYQAYKRKIPLLVALPFALNLIFNGLFTYIQFGLQNFRLATFDILLVLGTLIWGMMVVYRYNKVITYAQIPYLLWVSFATVLQISVTILNGGF